VPHPPGWGATQSLRGSWHKSLISKAARLKFVDEYDGFEPTAELQASVNKVQSRIPRRSLALAATLISICWCAAGCSGLGPAGTAGQREYGSRQYVALRQDQVFDLHVPGGLPGRTVTAPGGPADSDHPGAPNQGGRTWKVKHPSSGLLTVLIQQLKAHGVTFDSAYCGRNLILHGLQYLGPGTAGVYLTFTPYPVAPTSALTVRSRSMPIPPTRCQIH
jgi:hypothetical protein